MYIVGSGDLALSSWKNRQILLLPLGLVDDAGRSQKLIHAERVA